MTAAAPAINRRGLIRYAIGFDLVIIAVGIGLLLPSHPAVVLTLIIAAIALATLRGGSKVGFATTAFSIAAVIIAFEDIVGIGYVVLLVLMGMATSLFLGKRKRSQEARIAADPVATAALQKAAEHEVAQARGAAEKSNRRRERLLPLLIYLGLPVLVVVLYTNISDVLIRNFSVPSILQLLIVALAIPIVRYHDAFRVESVLLQPLTLALIGYCLFVFATSNWARDLGLVDYELVDLVKSLAILILVASLAVSWRALRYALIALVAAAAFLSAITLVQVAVDDPDMQFGGLAEIEIGHLFGDLDHPRPSGPVRDPNYFARILIVAIPVAAFLGVGRRRRMEQGGYFAAAGLIALASLFTYSRGGMVALAADGVLLVFVRRVRITLANALIAVAILAAMMPTTVGRRMLTMAPLIGADATALDNSLDKRRVLLEAGLRMLDDYPVVGVGAGNYGSHYPKYANLVGWSGRDYTPVGVRQYPHNLYLEMAVETGLLGLMVFAAAMGIALLALYRSRHKLLARGEQAHAALVTAITIALAGYLVSSLFLHSGYHRYLWLLLGFAVAAVRLTNEVQRADPA